MPGLADAHSHAGQPRAFAAASRYSGEPHSGHAETASSEAVEGMVSAEEMGAEEGMGAAEGIGAVEGMGPTSSEVVDWTSTAAATCLESGPLATCLESTTAATCLVSTAAATCLVSGPLATAWSHACTASEWAHAEKIALRMELSLSPHKSASSSAPTQSAAMRVS